MKRKFWNWIKNEDESVHGSVEDGFIIGFVVFFMAMAHIDKVFTEFPFFNELFQLLHIELVF